MNRQYNGNITAKTMCCTCTFHAKRTSCSDLHFETGTKNNNYQYHAVITVSAQKRASTCSCLHVLHIGKNGLSRPTYRSRQEERSVPTSPYYAQCARKCCASIFQVERVSYSLYILNRYEKELSVYHPA